MIGIFPETNRYLTNNHSIIRYILADIRRRMTDPGFRTRLLDYTHERYKIDETKRIGGIPQESFRKLSID